MKWSVLEAGSLLAVFGLLLLGVNRVVDSECANSPVPSSCNDSELAPFHQALYFLIYPLIAVGLVAAAIGLVLVAHSFLTSRRHVQQVDREKMSG